MVKVRSSRLVYRHSAGFNFTSFFAHDSNFIDIAVTNLWVNPLVSDLQPDAVRHYM